MNEAVSMVAFHSQRLKDSVVRAGGNNEIWFSSRNFCSDFQQNVLKKCRSVPDFNIYSHLGISDFPFFDFLSGRDFFEETGVLLFSTFFLDSDAEIFASLSCSFLTSSSLC